MFKLSSRSRWIYLFFIVFAAFFVPIHYQSREIDYSNLEELLKQKKWRDADRETSKLIGKILLISVDNRHFWGYSRIDILGQDRYTTLFSDKFHCNDFVGKDIVEIDRLWQKHSHNLYGFSVQSRILMSKLNIENESDLTKQAELFSKEVGWDKDLGWDKHWNIQDSDGNGSPERNIKKLGSLPSRYWIFENSPKPMGTNGVMMFLTSFYYCNQKIN
jgi:hypothetical protein